jgi:hypothetical protein
VQSKALVFRAAAQKTGIFDALFEAFFFAVVHPASQFPRRKVEPERFHFRQPRAEFEHHKISPP